MFHLQTVANLSGCEAKDSEALMHCLRAKSKEEILAINQVGRTVCLGGPDEQGVGLPSITYYSNVLTYLHGLVSFQYCVQKEQDRLIMISCFF